MPILSVGVPCSAGVPCAACNQPALMRRPVMAIAPRADLLRAIARTTDLLMAVLRRADLLLAIALRANLLMAVARIADLRGRLIAVMSFPRLGDGIAGRHEHLDPAGGLRLPHELQRHLLAKSMPPDGK